MLTLHSAFSLGPIFGWETKGIWACVLHKSFSYICVLDVRILNYPNWTSKTHVRVRFSGLPQLRLFICRCLDFWDWFSVRKRRKFGPVFFIEVVAASMNLMLGF